MENIYFVQKVIAGQPKRERIASGLSQKEAIELSDKLDAENTDSSVEYQFGVSLGGIL